MREEIEQPESEKKSAEETAALSGPVVVGIGASAGGLSALKIFFDNVPANTGIAFVVVVHLSPEHESHLADLLQYRVRVPVQQVTETTPIDPNRVYVIPPGYNLAAIDTHLRLERMEVQRNDRAPIDHFLRTLAATHDGHAIAVILTGTGTDGSVGVREIKAKGGLVVVQDPNEAEYDGMPQSAIATGMADLVLPVSSIPAAILRIVHIEPRVVVPADGSEIDGTEKRVLIKIFSLLRSHTGRDFTQYKQSTSLRRISRRMQLNYVEHLPAYLDKLTVHPEEIRALADDLLITVTNFFRDPEVFQTLAKEVIPKLFDRRPDDVRVWSVGCATGEEAYSLAILVLEEAGRRQEPAKIQIFATDVHGPSLVRAREGYYSADIENDVGPDRLRRFFQKQNEGYRIRKEVRELIVFSQHNVLSDPPFSRMDLICCRNLLIYLQGRIQDEVVELFHYATRPDGYLVLGPSETARPTDLFRHVDNAQKILQRRNVPAPEPRLPVFPWVKANVGILGAKYAVGNEPVSYGGLHSRIVERYAPPSLLVSPDDKMVHLSEHAGRYLVHPGGEPTQSVVKLVRPELRVELLAALQAARVEKRPTISRPIPVRFNGEASPVVLQIRPATDGSEEGFLLVTFSEMPHAVAEAGSENGDPADLHKLQGAESNLKITQQRLETVIDQYETSQEEMKASNEELQSTNEELRSTLEELETSKEELQSMNEELQTVNQENRHKVEELGLLSNDLQNLLTATDIATLFLDRDFRILRFTPKLGDLFNVRMMDRGRPLSDITHRLGYGSILSDARQVLDQLIPVEREVDDQSGNWFLMRLRPYRSPDERIEGIVITFVDITSRKRAEIALQQSDERLAQEAAVREELAEMSLAVVSSWSFAQAAGAILKTSLSLLKADFGAVYLIDPKTRELAIVAEQGIGNDLSGLFAIIDRDEASVSRRALRSRRRIVVEDLRYDPIFASVREAALQAGIRSTQSTPFVDSGGEVLGVLSTHAREVRSLRGQEEQILDLIARVSSAILERLRAEAALKEVTASLERRVEERTLEVRQKERQVRELASQTIMAAQTERARIAQVLHDDLQQLLFAIEMKLSILTEDVESSRFADLLAHVGETQTWVKRSIELARKMALDLTRQSIAKEGLYPALEWLAGQMREIHGLTVDLEMQAMNGLTIQQETGVLLFEIVRELLFNVVKHAAADRALVEVGRDGSYFVIRVIDRGKGFDRTAVPENKGYGMGQIRRQLAFIDGALQIQSVPGAGTTAVIRVPLGSAQPPESRS